jgi:hypothetical protein
MNKNKSDFKYNFILFDFLFGYNSNVEDNRIVFTERSFNSSFKSFLESFKLHDESKITDGIIKNKKDLKEKYFINTCLKDFVSIKTELKIVIKLPFNVPNLIIESYEDNFKKLSNYLEYYLDEVNNIIDNFKNEDEKKKEIAKFIRNNFDNIAILFSDDNEIKKNSNKLSSITPLFYYTFLNSICKINQEQKKAIKMTEEANRSLISELNECQNENIEENESDEE